MHLLTITKISHNPTENGGATAENQRAGVHFVELSRGAGGSFRKLKLTFGNDSLRGPGAYTAMADGQQ